MTNEEKSFYITTTLPYVNSKPHVGTAMEFIRADAIARYKRQMGFDVFFNTGTDEHGLKIAQEAEKAGKTPQEYVDEMAEHFKITEKPLNISFDRFIRTTDEDHIKAAQEFWKKCNENGFIYKKKYSGLYCIGDEIFLKEKDLVNGRCPNHPNQDLVTIEEENYFFAFSKFGEKLLEMYEKNPEFVIPDFRLTEMKKMIADGLEDFSISRLKEKVSWGVPVPDDDKQVMYVWFDALVNYVSTLGWPNDKENFDKYWTNGTPVQICGKDNTQHQALRWQAMLMAADLPPTRNILVNGFITSGGQKMAKSLGNVVDPLEIAKEYGTDALRYYFLRELHPYEDSDFTIDKFKEAYTANLVNGIGNLTNRIMKLSEDYLDVSVDVSQDEKFFPDFVEFMDKYDYRNAIDLIWQKIQVIDETIQEAKPFKVVKEDLEKGKEMIIELVHHLAEIEYNLRAFMPETAKKIKKAIEENKKPEEPMFPRKD